MKKILRIVLLSTLFLTSIDCYGQAGGGKEDPLVADTMNNVWTVTGFAAAGAIIGLSTLSFVDEPSEELKNIVTGAAIGVILGVGVVAYMQATKSKEMYEEAAFIYRIKETKEFSTFSRASWHKKNFVSKQSKIPTTFQFSTTF